MDTSNIYVALDNVRSLHNVGAIMRTCSFFGIKNLILIGYSGVTYDFKGKKVLHPDVKKTSLGAENDLEIYFLEDSRQLIDFAKKKSLGVFSVEQEVGSTDLFSWTPGNKAILVFGNEIKGVSEEIKIKSKEILEIKRVGVKNSLNVESACAIVLSKLVERMESSH